MLKYILLGAFIGATVGYIIPPGSFFWFTFGAIGGYAAGHYIDGHRY